MITSSDRMDSEIVEYSEEIVKILNKLHDWKVYSFSTEKKRIKFFNRVHLMEDRFIKLEQDYADKLVQLRGKIRKIK